MSRRRAQQLPASIAAVAMIAEEAHAATGRVMPEAEMCELITQAREIQFRQLLEQPATPPIGRIRWSPQAYATLRGLTGTFAEAFTDIATQLQAARESTPW